MVDKREIFVVHIEKKRSKALCVMTKQDALLFFWEWIGSTAIDLCYPMKPWSFSSFSRSVPSAFFKACLSAIFFAKRQIGDGFSVPNLYSGVVPGRMLYVLPQTSGTPMRYSFRSVAAKLLKSPGKRLLKRGVGTHCL